MNQFSSLVNEMIPLDAGKPGDLANGTAELDVFIERDAVYAVREVNSPPPPGGGSTSSWLNSKWTAAWVSDLHVGDRVVLNLRASQGLPSTLIDYFVEHRSIRGVRGYSGSGAPPDQNSLTPWFPAGWRLVSASAIGDINDRLALVLVDFGPKVSFHTVLLDVMDYGDVRAVMGASTPETHVSINQWLSSGWTVVANTNIGRITDRRAWLLRK